MSNVKAKFKIIDKEPIKATFKIQAVISAEDIEEALENEIARAKEAEQQLQENIDNIANDLDIEIQNRQNADIEIINNISELDIKVDGINANLTQQIEETQQDVNDKYNELVRDIDNLTDVIEEDFSNLDTKINTVSQTVNQRITNVADELNQTIEENVVALQNNINFKQDKLIAGENITIENNIISSTGGHGASSFAELEGDPYDNEALANVFNSLDIISLLICLIDANDKYLFDSNGLKLTARRR